MRKAFIYLVVLMTAALLLMLVLGVPYTPIGRLCLQAKDQLECTRDWSGLIIAIFALVGAFLAAIAAFGQMQAAQKQLLEMQSTGKQTEALIEANKQLARAAEQSAAAAAAAQRPYVVIKKVELISEVRREGASLQATIRATFANTGLTPAINAFAAIKATRGGSGAILQLQGFNDWLVKIPRPAPAKSIFRDHDLVFEQTVSLDAADNEIHFATGGPVLMFLCVGIGYFFGEQTNRLMTTGYYSLVSRDGHPKAFPFLQREEVVRCDELAVKASTVSLVT